ncbi:MAG: hypothetical protein J6A59_16145 [Lachnospiraceae bacterium]|nr:hypothetical protein [Lachnospiraceae bacterium]
MDWKKLGKRLLFPPVWAVVLLTVASTIALIGVFLKGLETAIIAYVVYVVAFYTLVTVCAYCIVYLPGYIRQTREKINDNSLGHRMLSEASFRTHISLYLSLCANLLYVGLNIFFYVENHSMWFVILAVYYTILVIVRLILAKYVRKDSNGTNQLRELKLNILCSGILLTLNIVLSGAVLMILYQDKGFTYNGILIYVMALYTFYTTIHAIVTLVKYRRLNRPVMTTVRAIQLFAALVSMLSLETAMFEEFGQDMTTWSKRLFIMLTGAGISITVLIMSIYMIVKSVKTIKNIKE